MPDINYTGNSFSDLSDDFEELRYLYEDRIDSFDKLLEKIKKGNFCQNRNTYLSLAAIAEKTKETLFRNYKLLDIKTNNLSDLISIKKSSFEALRMLQSVSASFFTALNWQSPSFLHSLKPQAGLDLNRIVGNENDYKRDVHLDGEAYEKKYKKEYVDCPLPYKLLVRTYATSSGMAAFTTILNFLMANDAIKDKVLIGKSTYFESKLLITNLFKDKVIQVNENETDNIISMVKKHKPQVLFIDSLANSSAIPLVDLKTIFAFLKNEYKEKISIVLDNTGQSVFFQPLPLIASTRNKISLFSYESLNKYAQFGMDRVTGGMITAYGKDIGKLFRYREHLGTNLPDNSVYCIPTPHRKLLEKRLLRLGRNASYLAEHLQNYIATGKNKKIKSIIYPSIGVHSNLVKNTSSLFYGSYFTFEIDKRYKNQRFFKSFLNKTIAEARKRDVQILSGTSFGLNTTRIYITAVNSEFGDPFIRISAGTECMEELKKMREVFTAVLSSV